MSAAQRWIDSYEEQQSRERQIRLRSSERRSMFILESTFYTSSGRYYALRRETFPSEVTFCNEWKRWEKSRDREGYLGILLTYLKDWQDELIEHIPQKRNTLHYHEQLRLQLGYLMGVAVAKGQTLEEFREAAWNYLDNIFFQ